MLVFRKVLKVDKLKNYIIGDRNKGVYNDKSQVQN